MENSQNIAFCRKICYNSGMNGSKDATKYTAGLTGEIFLFNESRILAGFLAQGEDADTLRARNLTENLIMYKKESSLKRVSPPIFRRLATMSPGALGSSSVQILNRRASFFLSLSQRQIDWCAILYWMFIRTNSRWKPARLRNRMSSAISSQYMQRSRSLRDKSDVTKMKLKQQLLKTWLRLDSSRSKETVSLSRDRILPLGLQISWPPMATPHT